MSARTQAQEYGALLMGGEVTSLRKEGDLFVVSGPDFQMQAKFVLLATGLSIMSASRGHTT